MVRVAEEKIDLEHVDFSFIPSLECNNRCSFCMYCASPDNKLTLNIKETALFIETVDWNRISSWGFYGGEPSINMGLYQHFIDMIPKKIPKFIITNGRWSLEYAEEDGLHKAFIKWCNHNRLWMKVSGTPEHIKYQNRAFLENFARITSEDGANVIGLKEDDDIHPMGRAAKKVWSCRRRCLSHPQPIRLAIFPTGDIILQNCDGVYPVVGMYNDPFQKIFEEAVRIRRVGWCGKTRNINDVLKELGLIEIGV